MWNIHSDLINTNIDLNPAVAGDNTVVTNMSPDTVTGKVMFLHALTLVGAAATDVTVKDSTGKVYGTFLITAAGGSVNLSDLNSIQGEPIFRLTRGANLVIGSSAAVRLTGFVKTSYQDF